ncbi:probable ubiquitin-like-specific protease 2A [Euphorbia lathyris]|uniref:probable ubiquitin-like-specific protease 2A n=1 Tax=Euphorbia lathyris TaxID=212925 RepID=UPI0033136658
MDPSDENTATSLNSQASEPCIRYVRRKKTRKQPEEEIECLKISSPQPDDEIECLEISSSRSSRPVPYRRKSRMRVKGKATSGTLLSTKEFDIHFGNLWKNLPEDKRMPFTYFDCLWFSAYMQSPEKECMQSWIKDKPIFTKKYVLLPIVYWSHWNLLIFCNFGESSQLDNVPCMLLLDSLQMAGPKRFEPDIRKFVSDIFKFEGRPKSKKSISEIPLLVPKVPQQTNDEDCGNFVLYFIDLFVRNAPAEFMMNEYPYFMTEQWFELDGFKDFCKKLVPLDEQ